MRHYETIYIVSPNLGEEEYKGILEKVQKLIENQKGVIVKTEEWGIQRMAYVVKKQDKGAYVLVNYCADSGLTAELERALKIDERILLYQTVKLADRADPEDLLRKEEDARKGGAGGEGGTEEEGAAPDSGEKKTA